MNKTEIDARIWNMVTDALNKLSDPVILYHLPETPRVVCYFGIFFIIDVDFDEDLDKSPWISDWIQIDDVAEYGCWITIKSEKGVIQIENYMKRHIGWLIPKLVENRFSNF